MLHYKCTISREHNLSGLKPTATDKLLTRFHSLQQAPFLMSIMYKMHYLYSV